MHVLRNFRVFLGPGAGSMQLSGVRLSVSSGRRCCGPDGDIGRLLHSRRSTAATPQHGAQQQMWAVSRS